MRVEYQLPSFFLDPVLQTFVLVLFIEKIMKNISCIYHL